MTISGAELESIVTALSEKLNRYYVLDGIAPKIASVLTDNLHRGVYAQHVDNPAQLAEVFTTDLRSVNGDKHLALRFQSTPLTEEPDVAKEFEEEQVDGDESKWPPMMHAMAEMMKLCGGGFFSVRRLEGNVGYFDLHSLILGKLTAERMIRAAFELVQYTNALIIDLRRCIGGAGESALLIESYLFEKKTDVTEIFWKPPNKKMIESTLDSVDGPKYLNKPVYILTSSSTFSAAEALCVVLQAFGRAKVIGETTSGGGHPCTFVRAGHDHFQASISIGKTICLASGKGWEGVGCIPDVQVSPLPGFVPGSSTEQDLVLDTAYLAAARDTLSALQLEPDADKSRGRRQLQVEAATTISKLEARIQLSKGQSHTHLEAVTTTN